MTEKPPAMNAILRREVLVIVAFTLLGGVLRMWRPARLGMVHFDEGIYALAGLWVYSPRGLLDLDPTSIAYAPPGFPVLVGLSYLALGVGDLAPILVSIVAGTLTIPVAAWVARRTFGSGAGPVAAAFAAFSGQHIAFSRMALTDASFLLFWVLAIGQGQRFLERPSTSRALSLGVAVAIVQLFKYNGWISGLIVALSALVWLAAELRLSRWSSAAATWGWGLGALLVAALLYWPWFGFVEAHGGYRALLAHQRGYLGGFSSWPGHLWVQLAQADALSAGPNWIACAGLAAALGLAISAGDFAVRRRFLPRVLARTFYLATFSVWRLPNLLWVGILLCWLCYMLIFWRSVATKAMVALGMGWTIMMVFTPFYHPYARLWLPIESFSWLFLGSLFVWARSGLLAPASPPGRGRSWPGDRLLIFGLYCVFVAALHVTNAHWAGKSRWPRLLDTSDSLRHACRLITAALPRSVTDLHVFARPPVAFYLGLDSRVSIHRQGDVAHLLSQNNPTAWAVLDMAMIRQAHSEASELDRLEHGWVAVREIPTTLNLPTLLDIDPAAFGQGLVETSAGLRLLRPNRTGRSP
jgi:hypothetical protein